MSKLSQQQLHAHPQSDTAMRYDKIDRGDVRRFAAYADQALAAGAEGCGCLSH